MGCRHTHPQKSSEVGRPSNGGGVIDNEGANSMTSLIADRDAMIDRMISLDADRVATINRMMSLDADRVATINRLMAIDEDRLRCVGEMKARCLRSGLDRPLGFMHVPKTSGMAIVNGLVEVLPGVPFQPGLDRSMFGTFKAFETLSAETRAVLWCDGLPSSAEIDFVGGHLAYSTLRSGRPNARLMTILREGRSRLLSLWMFWRALPFQQRTVGIEVHKRCARRALNTLVDFLNDREIAYQTDNITVRMLLWPHALIPDDDFIDPSLDVQLLEEAAARLKEFRLVDVVENPNLEENLRELLARPFVYQQMNETATMPSERRTPLCDQLSGKAVRALEDRSRLDRELWLAVVRGRMPWVNEVSLGNEVFDKNIDRHAALMRGERQRSATF